MSNPLTPRARAILAAVEREVSARLEEIEREADVIPARRITSSREPQAGPARARRITSSREPMRAEPLLLAALEMGVAGLSREEVAAELGIEAEAALLDSVFGAGSPPQARLARAA